MLWCRSPAVFLPPASPPRVSAVNDEVVTCQVSRGIRGHVDDCSLQVSQQRQPIGRDLAKPLID